MKQIILLGASGSIGKQTIDIIKEHPDAFSLVAYSVGHNLAYLEELIEMMPVCEICVAEQQDALALSKRYPHIHFTYGEEGLCHLAALPYGDVVVNALVGFRGLKPTLTAIQSHKVLALANKESLVTGGELVKQALQAYDGVMYPIDSEHSAIFQCLQGNSLKEVKRLIITASGGSFRDKKREELANVTVTEALAHPNWNMGGRITIDSATMMNKGFEVIEAHYLFDLPYEQIDTVIHPQSIIHSMVEYQDHAVMAQLGTADMRIPIQYALTYPERFEMKAENRLDLHQLQSLEFKEMDFERFPLLSLAYEVGKKKGNLGAVLNGADEEAVGLFLDGKLAFLDIERLVMEACNAIAYIEHPTYEQLKESDLAARKYVQNASKGVIE